MMGTRRQVLLIKTITITLRQPIMVIMAFIRITSMLPTTPNLVTTTFVALLVITMPAALTIHMMHVAQEAPTRTTRVVQVVQVAPLRLL
jgi:hypothetical protein